MVRQTGKQTLGGTARLVLICVGLLGIGLIADFFWASSSRFNTSLSFSNTWSPPPDTALLSLPSKAKSKIKLPPFPFPLLDQWVIARISSERPKKANVSLPKKH
ncbi:kelch repeat-containing protein [Corchorus olitorius]|uniref:Kelch repeat-containing protein n=1 Tax=Corchorus olitorius TaxID=93759 RepID=A0A1R3HIW1_9ROSI|nr:kelch repeat-containing protein [Corchorus olitorius]